MPQELYEKIQLDLTKALKARNDAATNALRLLISAIRNKEIELRKKDIGLGQEEIIDVVHSEVKKRRDSIAEFEKAARNDLTEKEKRELDVVSVYLPPEISDAELERVVSDGIRECGADSQKDFGRVMKIVMPILKRKASGERVSAMLKKILTAQ